MNDVILQGLTICVFVLFYGKQALAVGIEVKKSELLGENGTELKCIYTQENISHLFTVSFLVFNRSSTTFDQIATYLPGKIPLLPQKGQYLLGRATLTAITTSSRKAVITFNNLMCIDDTFYQCRVFYLDSGNTVQNLISNNISISIQVPPSKPDRVSIVPKQADPTRTPATHVEDSTSSLSSTGILKENETFSAMQPTKLNDTTAFNSSTLPTTDKGNQLSTVSNDDFSSNISYKTTTYTTQQSTKKQYIAEGDYILVVCTGDVGKPPAKHVFEKHLNGKIVPMHGTVPVTSISEMSANCSFYRTSNITFRVTSEDNNAVIRCVVNSSMAGTDMYIETAPIEVYFRMPTIYKYPNKTEYELVDDTSIQLACKSDGNPKPSYYWYKENPKEHVGSNANFTITNMNITNSGTYICEVINTFDGDTYQKAAMVKFKIINEADKSNPSSSGGNKAKDNGTHLAIATVVVLIVIGVVVVLIYVLYRRTKQKKDYHPVNIIASNMDKIESPKTTTRVQHTNSTKKTTGYEDVDLDSTDMKPKLMNDEETIDKVKQHNDEYLKKHQEDEEKKKDNPTTSQAAVYAFVNKPKNTTNTENKPPAEQQEEDVYEESKEGIYDTSGVRRHKEKVTAESYDSTENLKTEERDHTNLFSDVDIKKSFENDIEDKEEKRQIPTVSPTVRLSFESQNDDQSVRCEDQTG